MCDFISSFAKLSFMKSYNSVLCLKPLRCLSSGFGVFDYGLLSFLFRFFFGFFFSKLAYVIAFKSTGIVDVREC